MQVLLAGYRSQILCCRRYGVKECTARCQHHRKSDTSINHLSHMKNFLRVFALAFLFPNGEGQPEHGKVPEAKQPSEARCNILASAMNPSDSLGLRVDDYV